MQGHRPVGPPERAVPTVGTAAELVAFSGLLVSYIWLWKGSFPGNRALVAAFAIVAGAGRSDPDVR
ncbi:MAG: hypothetical protein LAO05_13455 [Acidobacteriia bacterium]|nr:hypothetical protein [Terriglobia bacterium]